MRIKKKFKTMLQFKTQLNRNQFHGQNQLQYFLKFQKQSQS